MMKSSLYLAGLALFILNGCGLFDQTPVAYVPIKDSPAEQYRYAVEQRTLANLALIRNEDKFRTEREVVRQTFAKVAEYFPEDRTFTPLARLEVLEMQAGLDSPRVDVSGRALEARIDDLLDLAEEYPDHDFIQVKTLYDLALIYKSLGRYGEAQDYFLMIMENYRDHPDATIQNLAERARFFYNQTYVSE